MELEITGTDEAVQMFDDLAENATKIDKIPEQSGTIAIAEVLTSAIAVLTIS